MFVATWRAASRFKGAFLMVGRGNLRVAKTPPLQSGRMRRYRGICSDAALHAGGALAGGLGALLGRFYVVELDGGLHAAPEVAAERAQGAVGLA